MKQETPGPSSASARDRLITMLRSWFWVAVTEKTVEIVCLANSRKHDGRCLAGIEIDGTWVRPIGSGPKGALCPAQYHVAGGREACVLDRLQVRLAGPAPKPHQPENWRLERRWYNPWYRPCRLAARITGRNIRRTLEAHLTPGPELLGCRRDRVDFGTFTQAPAAASLTLVRPEDLRWLIKTSGSGKRQTRAVFRLAGAAYNLSLTDPLWEQRLAALPFGEHPREAAGIEPDSDVLLTISLGEPFADCCYKLVAAVIVFAGEERPPTPDNGGPPMDRG